MDRKKTNQIIRNKTICAYISKYYKKYYNIFYFFEKLRIPVYNNYNC